MTLTPSSNRVAARRFARAARLVAFARFIRARARLISALVLLSFVLCHLVSHISLNQQGSSPGSAGEAAKV